MLAVLISSKIRLLRCCILLWLQNMYLKVPYARLTPKAFLTILEMPIFTMWENTFSVVRMDKLLQPLHSYFRKRNIAYNEIAFV